MPARVGLLLHRHMCGEVIESDVMSTKRGREVRVQQLKVGGRGHWTLEYSRMKTR